MKKPPKKMLSGIMLLMPDIFIPALWSGRLSPVSIFKDTFVIMGPSHTGMGAPFSILTEGTWRTPLGDVEIDTELAKAILANSSHLKEDRIAHLQEHSIEVQLPFIQYLQTGYQIRADSAISHKCCCLPEYRNGNCESD